MDNQTYLKYLTAVDTHQLRLKVLKVEGEEYEYDYKGDNLPSTFHLGLMRENHIVCIASFFDNPCAESSNSRSVQLRGMATETNFHGHGYGKLIMQKAIEECRDKGFDLLWCNARIRAIPFYEKMGFEVISDPFMVPRVGMHRVMKRAL